MEQLRGYGLGPTRAEAMAALGLFGYAFELQVGTPDRPRRPRAIGRSADGQCRVELIGPEEHVFKAVLIADLSHTIDAATRFLGYFVPDWAGAGRWVSEHLAQPPHPVSAEVSLPRLRIHLRQTGHRDRLVLTLTWVPD